MSENLVSLVDPPGALERLGRALADYGRVSRRTSEEVLVKKGEDLAMRQPGGNSLHALFKAQVRAPGAITAAASLRHFRLGRRHFGGVDGQRGISETAYNRARQVMGDYLWKHSILASPSYNDGRISLGAVRVGIRGRRLRGRHVRSYGKRALLSNGGRSGLSGFAVGGDNTELRQAGDVRLNFRAVATVMELNLREAGRNFLASAFLFRRFARIQKQRVLRVMNPRSTVAPELGTAALEASTDGSNSIALRLTSTVPGTMEIGRVRGIFARALGFLRRDLEEYLACKQRETLVGEMRKAIA